LKSSRGKLNCEIYVNRHQYSVLAIRPELPIKPATGHQ